MAANQRPPRELQRDRGSRRTLSESLASLGILLLIGMIVVTLRADRPADIAGVIGAVGWLLLPLWDGRQ